MLKIFLKTFHNNIHLETFKILRRPRLLQRINSKLMALHLFLY